jgi:hypothetical protein
MEAKLSKIDLKKDLKHLYSPPSGFSVVDVPPLQFLMIDGHGDPNTAPEYAQAVEALFAVAYKAKFLSKKRAGQDYAVMPLEGLWWAADMEAFNTARDKSAWDWTMMILQPEWITSKVFEEAAGQAAGQKELPALSRMRLETYHEGLSVQILHVGSYEDEGAVLQRLHREFLPENRLEPAGKHHEIYLGDPRKTAPEKLKTVLRQPVRRLP